VAIDLGDLMLMALGDCVRLGLAVLYEEEVELLLDFLGFYVVAFGEELFLPLTQSLDLLHFDLIDYARLRVLCSFSMSLRPRRSLTVLVAPGVLSFPSLTSVLAPMLSSLTSAAGINLENSY
jgi:hypothetical protein